VHEQPGGYGQESHPNQPQGQGPGGYPPQQPPYPGQQPGSQQPPYGQPAPYGQPDQYGQQPPYGAQQPPGGSPWDQPGAGGYGPQDPNGPGGPSWSQPGPGGFGPQDPMGPGGWGPPPGPPGKSNSGPVIAVAAVAALVLLGGGGAIVWALSSGDDPSPTPPVAVSTPPTTVPSFTPPTAMPSFPSLPTPTFPLPTPSGSSSLDESMLVQAGDCVRITGKTPHLKMFRASCGSAPYKVLKKFSGTADRTKCRSVSGYTTAFWAKSKKYSFLSYVLCLKHQ
jgi:hypothetical protein